MDPQRMTVLLAGDTAAQCPTLREWLESHRCECRVADTFEKTCRVLSEAEFDLILCQYDLPDRTAFPFLDWFEGTHSTLMFSSRAMKDTRWLPVVERGTRCLDRPLLRTEDLPNALEKLQETLVTAFRPENQIAGQTLQHVGAH